jgi:hypothetical protein
MQLFVQLDAADLPEEFAARLLGGLVQLFYCMRDDPFCASDCEAWAHHSRSTLVRLLPRELADQRQRVVDPAPDMFPPQRVVGWTAVLDLPGSDELEELGVNLTDQECEALWQRRRVPHDGSKLGGWPLWVQHVEYPNCRLCGRRMEMLFQLDAEDPVAYLFAAGGVGHITQCATHRAEVAFGWACG